VAQEAPNNLRSRAVVRIIDILSEGPIEGLATGVGNDGAKSIYFNNTPLMSDDGTWNFKGVTWEVRTGLPDQSPVSGYPSAEQSVPVGVQAKKSIPVVRTITSATATALRVTVRIPALYTNTSQGDLNPGPTLEYKFEIRPVSGAWSEVVTEKITGGKCTSPYERSYRFDLPTSASNSWEVRMTRLTDDSTTVTIANDTYWSAYDLITDHQLIYPNTAYIALTFDAEAFGAQLPTRTYDIKGIQCRVPTNYDPVARTYATTGPGTSAGAWDGASWKIAWTNNNAWVLFDLLSTTRYGAGLSASALSAAKWDLYTISQYCDAVVPNGFGSTEPRYTMNVAVMDQEDAYRLLQKFVASFRGMVYWAGGSMAVSADMPTTPAKLLTQANVLDGDFSYENTSLASRHNAARVVWRDPGDSWSSAVEMVEDYTTTYLPGQRVADVVAFGVTSRGLANRLGRWLIDTENKTPETVTFRVSIDNMDIRPGDVVAVADRYYAGMRMGGRLLAGSTTTQLRLDDVFAPVGGQTYSISVMLPDGTLVQNRSVSSWTTAEGKTTATVAALPAAPAAGGVFLITSTSISPRLFRVVGIVENERAKFTVVALQFDPNKFSRVENNLVLPSPVFSTLQDQLLAPLPRLGERSYSVSTSGGSAQLTGVDPTGLEIGMRVAPTEPYPVGTAITAINTTTGVVTLSAARTGAGAYTGPIKFHVVSARSYLVGVGTTTTIRVTVSWYQPTDIRVDTVEVRVFTTEGFVSFHTSTGASADIDGLTPGTYFFGVRAIGRDKRAGDWIDSHGIAVSGVSQPPPPLSGLSALGGVRRVQVNWTASTIRDLKHYEIWRKIGGTTPAADPATVTGAAFLRYSGSSSATDNDTATLLPSTTAWYWVRAISTTDVAGAWAGPVSGTTSLLESEDIDSRGLDIKDTSGNTVFGANGSISGSAYVNIDGNNVLISEMAAAALVPTLNFVGQFASAPTQAQLGAAWKQNAVYRNTTDSRNYVLTGSPLGWVIYLEDGQSFVLTIESTNGTVFRVGAASSTTLKARLFKNGAEVTDVTPEAWFRWRRVSAIPQSPPNDDAAWNALYVTGYRQVTINVDSVYARATFFCDVISP
jgi:predicted phage tail protein